MFDKLYFNMNLSVKNKYTSYTLYPLYNLNYNKANFEQRFRLK